MPVWVAVPMLIVFICFKAVARAIGGVRKWVYYPFTIFFVGIIILFMLVKGGWRNVFFTLGGVIGGGLGTIIAQVLKLASVGHFSIYLAGFIVLALVVVRLLGIRMGNIFFYHLIFSIGAPILVLLTFLATASSGNWQSALLIGGSLLALVVMLEALYIMVFGLVKSQKSS